MAREVQHWLAGHPGLLLREQPAGVPGAAAVLYVHGATFPSAASLMLKLDGVSWADRLNEAGLSAWALDLAGYGGSERYAEMDADVPPEGEPLGRAPAAAEQIERAVRHILAARGRPRVSLIAHSWGTIAAAVFAIRRPEMVERLVFFAPITRRTRGPGPAKLGTWRYLTLAEQHARFVEDVPPGHPPVLLDRHFANWAQVYLDSDATSRRRAPPSVKTPNGPVADIAAAWSGALAYDPAGVKVPVAIVRGEWDSLCTDEDAAWLRSGLAASPETCDIKIAKGTHLMHLEASRAGLYRAASAFLAGGAGRGKSEEEARP